MIEAAFILFVLPQVIYPLARAQGRDAQAWTIFAAGVCLSVGLVVFFGYYFTYGLLAYLLNFDNEPQKFWLDGFIRPLARVCGILGGYAVYRHLDKQQPDETVPPPAPPDFN